MNKRKCQVCGLEEYLSNWFSIMTTKVALLTLDDLRDIQECAGKINFIYDPDLCGRSRNFSGHKVRQISKFKYSNFLLLFFNVMTL